MNNQQFEYVPSRTYKPVKKEIISIVKEVQKIVKSKFSINFYFVGSSKWGLITQNVKGNIGFDFDLNFQIINEGDLTPKQIKTILINALNKVIKKYGYDPCEDSTRVITFKMIDKANSKIIHSCDICLVRQILDEDDDWYNQYIHFNKGKNVYYWADQTSGYDLDDKIEWIKDYGLWDKNLKPEYLSLKNRNNNPDKKSRSLFAETVNNVCNSYGYYEEDEDEDGLYLDTSVDYTWGSIFKNFMEEKLE